MNYIKPQLQTFASFFKGRFFTLIFFIALLSTGYVANAQIIAVEATTSGQSATTNLTFAHNRGTAANTLTLVSVQLGRQTTISGNVTYGGTAMTLVGESSDGTGTGRRATVYIYRIFNAATGNQNIVINVSGSNRIAAGAISFSNVSPTTPLRAYIGSNSTTANNSNTATLSNVATGAGDIVFSAISYSNGNNNPTYGAGQTERWNEQTATANNDRAKGAASTKSNASGSTTSISYANLSNSWWGAGAVSVVLNTCVNASVSKVDAVCGGSSGSITLSSPTGGSGNYQYRLGTGAWQAGASFTGLASGTYSVQIRDTNDTSCEVNLGNQTIIQIGALNATVSRTNRGCTANGTITVSSPNGGSGSFQYRLDAGTWQASNLFTGLDTGTYSVQIRDANNTTCESTLGNQTIALLATLTATVSRINQICGRLGRINFNNSSGGSGTFEYRLNSGAWQSSANFTNLVGGTYTPQIRDAASTSCIATLAQVTVNGLAGLDSDGDSVPDTCDLDDDNDGILDDTECIFVALNSAEFDGTFGSISNTNRNLQTPAVGYTYGGTGTNAIDAEGTYVVTSYSNSTNIHSLNAIWDNLFGHTTGTVDDAYLAVNGSTVQSVFYEQVINVVPSSTYRLSLWAINAIFQEFDDGDSSIDPNLEIRVLDGSNNVISTVTTGPIPNTLVALGANVLPFDWSNSTLDFSSGANTSLRLQVRNISVQVGGNDFAIDDITIVRTNCANTDGDALTNALDNDSDSDGCADAIEGAGNFTAANIDANGRLLGGVNGFGVPNVALTAQGLGDILLATALTVTTAPTNQVSAAPAGATFTIATTASNNTSWSGATNARVPVYGTPGNANAQRVFRWFLGNPDAGGTALTNAGVYSGVTAASLVISNTTGLSGNEYYVVVSHSNNACIREVRSARLFCVKPGITSGGTQQSSNVAISIMRQDATGFQNRNNGHLILEAKTKGFVITRLTTANLPTGTAAVKGMLVYDTTVNCLKLYNGTIWGCLTPSCPD